jgi:ABC-2 type transport system permease protein
MSRVFRIAEREYVSYIRTVGFWLSLCMMPLVLGASLFIPSLMDRSSPAPHIAVVDLTSAHLAGPLSDALRERTGDGPPPIVVAAPPEVRGATDPRAAGARLRGMLGDTAKPASGGLDAAIVLSGAGDHVQADLWTRNLADGGLEAQVRQDLADILRHKRLIDAGVSPGLLAAADAAAPTVTVYSPKAAQTGQVSLRDKLPSIAGFAMGFVLWMVVLTGAGLLLNSVIEEKSSRILEVLLTSASVPEVMGGKILGVAAVTLTILGLWGTIGAVGLGVLQPAIAADVVEVLFAKGLIVYFALYLVFGYLMYASIFAAVGAFCETTREAQTLLGPVMLTLTVPLIMMGQSIRHPDAPILQTLSWIPPFTPFLMVARAASDPPLWQSVAALALMATTTVVVVWVSGRAFRAGALSIGKTDRKAVWGAFFGRAG